MHGVAVDECVGDEGPDIGAPPARQRPVHRNRRVVARRDEGEGEQKIDILVTCEQIAAREMHEHAHDNHRDDGGRHVEDRFGALGHAGKSVKGGETTDRRSDLRGQGAAREWQRTRGESHHGQLPLRLPAVRDSPSACSRSVATRAPINANPRRPRLARARGGARAGACTEASSTPGKTRATAPLSRTRTADGAGRNKMRQGWPMKSASTSKLFAYWNERRGSRLAPERGDIEPGAIL